MVIMVIVFGKLKVLNHILSRAGVEAARANNGQTMDLWFITLISLTIAVYNVYVVAFIGAATRLNKHPVCRFLVAPNECITITGIGSMRHYYEWPSRFQHTGNFGS